MLARAIHIPRLRVQRGDDWRRQQFHQRPIYSSHTHLTTVVVIVSDVGEDATVTSEAQRSDDIEKRSTRR